MVGYGWPIRAGYLCTDLPCSAMVCLVGLLPLLGFPVYRSSCQVLYGNGNALLVSIGLFCRGGGAFDFTV